MSTQENELNSPDDKPDAEASKDSDTPTEKPEPDEGHKEEAAKMMTAYEDRPTLVLPGTGGAVSGTAVNSWLDDEGNPKAIGDEDAPAAHAESGDTEPSDEGLSAEEQLEKDKEYNKAVLEMAESQKDLSEEEIAKSEREEKSVTR